MADEKQHQALYRRYRPQTPAELLGQEHVVRALTGAIHEGRLHHAFLFCGPRGTGKTSTARILAKMVNCEQAPTAEPCGACEQCVAIREGSHVDVVEIDAASHGGVDDARDLREKAPTAPMAGREKVYIIDEAQRLSREAFDALLKLFEEPPPGVRFVLATTEPHKMPATIVGRCQRFDFRRLTMEDLAAHLMKVAASEGVQLDEDAARTIARRSEGSARDALSLLDQATVMGGLKVDDAVIRSLLGSPRGEVQVEMADVLAVGDVRGVFEVVARLVQDGQDLRNVTAEALAHFRNLLLAKTAPGQEDLVDVPSDAYEVLRVQSEKFSTGEISRLLSLLLAAHNDMRWTTSPRLSLELALVRACMPDTDPTPAGLVSRLERLERLAGVGSEAGAAAGARPAEAATSPRSAPGAPEPKPAVPKPAVPKPAEPKPAEPKPAEPKTAPSPPTQQAEQQPAPQSASTDSVDVAMLRRSWGSLMDHLGQQRQQILRALLESATVASFENGVLEIAFPPGKGVIVEKVQQREAVLKQALSDMFGVSPVISCVVREARDAASAPITMEVVEEEETPDEKEALRRVQEMLGAKPIDRAGD